MFKKNIIENQMMHDAIAKISSEYFPLDRLVHDKASALADFIFAIDDFFIEFEQFFFVAAFKGQGVGGFALVFSRVKIRAKQIKQQLPVAGGVHNRSPAP